MRSGAEPAIRTRSSARRVVTRRGRCAPALVAGFSALGVLGCSPQADDGSTATAAAARPGSIESAPLGRRTTGDGPMFEPLGAARTGIDFENRFDWDNERKHLYPHGYAGGGVCVGDCDGDGLPDIYLVSQVGPDRLYRNLGDFRFEDATEGAGLSLAIAWGTGASFADVDDDGDLDLYVCNYDAPNRLWLNRGDGTFEEAAAARGIGFSGASVMSAFADYDLDGDLDLYLLTNRLYPGPGLDEYRPHFIDGKAAVAPDQAELFAIQERLIDGEAQKFVIKAGQRDRLYRNDGAGSFTDVSDEAGITGLHPGLGVVWWDYNGDRRPDLYVSNDFWDPDRLYRNNGDGTFTDVLAQTLPHTPWFSMGSDAADIDNDGRPDLLAADMSATTHYMSKIMMGDMNDSRWFLESAEPRQYMRNALYLNTGTDRFMEVAFLAGLASSDWTWSVKFADFDNDGRVDVFFTNGTANHTFDPDHMRRLEAIERSMNRERVTDPVARWQAQWDEYRKLPPRREANLVFRNAGDLTFERAAERWGLDHVGLSFGAACADLDRDGDLDVVVNNTDDPASVYRNNAASGRRVLIRLKGTTSNAFGVGAAATVETSSGRQVRCLAPTSGYMSANEPLIHVGLGEADAISRLRIDWPSGHVQTFDDLPADRFYTITEPGGAPPEPTGEEAIEPQLFRESSAETDLRVDAVAEQAYDDYAREPLLPAKLSHPGPGVAWGDVDGDGDDDCFIGSPAGRAGTLFVNRGGGSFAAVDDGPWMGLDTRREDTAALFFDAESDGDLDLYVASGSVECPPGDWMLRDRLYINDGTGRFSKAAPDALPDVADSTGAVVAGDIDRDGDLDLFVGARSIPGRYPLAPSSRLLRNDGGRFIDVTERVAPGLGEAGLVTGALFSDVDGDGRLDLLVTVEWGPVRWWRNTDGAFVEHTAASGLDQRSGWWNAITGADLDGDGDIDYVLTNAGLNTKYAASREKPALLYYGDLDGSGHESLVEAKTARSDLVLPVRGRSCSSAAMPFIALKMPTFHDFASAALPEIYGEETLSRALVLEATCLESGVLINEGSGDDGSVRFAFRPLPRIAQAAPGVGVVATDFDGDGATDVYVAQNFFWREPETGRWDGGIGVLLKSRDGWRTVEAVPWHRTGLIAPGDARSATTADLDDDGRPDLVVGRNSDSNLVFLNRWTKPLAVRLRAGPGNPAAVGALVRVVRGDGGTQTAEVYAGSGHLSQSAPTLFFGRGDASAPASVHVRWPDGAETVHEVAPGIDRIVIERPAE